MAGWQMVHVDDVPEIDNGRCPMRPVRHHLGITAFGLTAWTARNAGDRIVNEHDEDEPDAHEEAYLVLRGRATFEVDGTRVEAPQGTFVFVPPKVLRTAFAEEPGTTIVAIGAPPGKAYEPSGWEIWSPLRRLYEAGDLEEVVARGRELVEANPGVAGLLYNLACCETLTGRKQDALEHLRRAIELSGLAREYARGDPDLDALRDDPAFRELVGR
jgi:tetratricopeptide (TPR) repeat protein